MTLWLDPPRRHGALRVAVLCDREREAQAWAGAVMARAHKVPAAVLIAEDGRLRAFDLAGRQLDVAVLEAARPGLIAAMLAPDSA